MPLSKEQRVRLQKLADSWEKPPGRRTPETCPSDLKLLLEHFAPLRELIRKVAAAEPFAQAAAPSERHPNSTAASDAGNPRELQRQIEELKATVAKASKDRAEYQQGYQRLRSELEQKERELKDALSQQQYTANKLASQQDEVERLRATYQQEPQALTLLRQDDALAGRLGLSPLPESTIEALIQAAAVLSQQPSLEALWALLHERCEEERRAASVNEVELLSTALDWCNHSRKRQRYQLLNAATGEPYDYERQLRSRHISTGESVAQQRLPGIASGSEKILCKPLVTTR